MPLPALHAAQQFQQQPQLPSQPIARRAQTRVTHRTGHASGLQQRRTRVLQDQRFLLGSRPTQQLDHPLHLGHRQRRAAGRCQHRRLVAHGQPRQLSRQAHRQHPQTQLTLRLRAQPFQQGQSPTHPALVPAQQLGRRQLRQAVLAHQRLDEPGFLQLLRPTPHAVEPEDGRLGRTLVEVQHAHVQRRPRNLGGCRPPLEAVEQLGPALPPTGRHRRQLSVACQRPGHRRLGGRIGQPVTPVTLAQLLDRQRSGLGVLPVAHAPVLHTPQSRSGNGGPGEPGPTRCQLGSGSRENTLDDHSTPARKTSRIGQPCPRRPSSRGTIPPAAPLSVTGFAIQDTPQRLAAQATAETLG
jgi:hypothetical protein